MEQTEIVSIISGKKQHIRTRPEQHLSDRKHDQINKKWKDQSCHNTTITKLDSTDLNKIVNLKLRDKSK
uniref:Uncharacterized protein n=1 Tax=Solanum tuberosum TaxID=4113 RepID=M0ZUI9_SOLTU